MDSNERKLVLGRYLDFRGQVDCCQLKSHAAMPYMLRFPLSNLSEHYVKEIHILETKT